MTDKARTYYGGPYDGETVGVPVLAFGFAGAGLVPAGPGVEHRLPLKSVRDDAGRLIVHPLGSFERYVCVRLCPCYSRRCPNWRYEYAGRVVPSVTA